ncbi:MAG: glycosyltransferase family 39 protein [Methanobacteriota archaeon]
MKIKTIIHKYQAEWCLLGILIVAAILFFANLGKEGYSNSYYAAAVKSMLTNPGIILFNSFDPVGFVTIDKPPVSLWIQTLSASVFGFSGFSLILPQAIAGICSVYLIYRLVARSWGKPAGLIAAATLTITPIFVAVVRTNNMDGLLVFVLLAAVFMALNAWKFGSPWYLFGAMILIGIGFNIKMIQALVVLPACFGIYLLNDQISWRKKILHLAAASALVLVVSTSWAVMMDLTPSDERPYIGSSSGNSEMDLIFGYNGLNRILGGFGQFGNHNFKGNTSFPGNFPQGADALAPSLMNGYPTGPSPIGDNTTPGHPQPGMNPGDQPGGRSGINDGGEPGLFRMGDSGMSGQISWLLPFALIGLLAWISRPSLTTLKHLNERAILTIALVLWLIPEILYFSFTSGFYHTYYVVMVAVPLSGLVGISIISLYEAYQTNQRKGWILIAAILITGIIQWQFLRYEPDFSGVLPWIILFGTVIGALILAVIRTPYLTVPLKIRRVIIVLVIGLLFIAPCIWSCTPVIYQGNSKLPVAGPSLVSGAGGFQGMNHGMEEYNSSALYMYLSSHQSGERYLVAVESSRTATDFIITYGAPVMTMGGYSGTDPILTVEKLKDYISSGKIRYFLIGGGNPGMPGRDNSGVTTWIKDSCPVIDDAGVNTGDQSVRTEQTLYDCKGIV